MMGAPDTEAAFKKRAAAWFRKAICDLRIWRANAPATFSEDSERSLHRLEKVAGRQAPHRIAACGDCPGCLLKETITIH